MEIDYQKAYRSLIDVLVDQRREVMKFKADKNNAKGQAQKIKELSDLIDAVSAAADDDKRRFGI
ncbi:hypothetical protein [Paracoccus yeei]|uniref:hypothetical protein n=1 Tax=Paracoccus yeei TaxID=147645 RepID=UPI001C8ED5DE|nr:hypothetical protein [Paracoccus yeei]MBY0138173.1 hypothetical protein [Paracoccus yeei]